MALINKKLTDRNEASEANLSALIHIVDPSDITDSAQGSSYKISKSNFLKDIYEEGGANITVNNPVTSTETSLDDALADIEAASGATNLGYTPSPTDGIVTSDTGTDATIPLADATNAGLLKPAKYTVLENTSNTNTGDEPDATDSVKGIAKLVNNLDANATDAAPTQNTVALLRDSIASPYIEIYDPLGEAFTSLSTARTWIDTFAKVKAAACAVIVTKSFVDTGVTVALLVTV